jgi:phosphoglycolate phosphatase
MSTRDVLLFDLDGTLVDSASTIGQVLNAMRAARGHAPHDSARYRSWVSLGAEQLIANALDAAPDQVAELLAAFRAAYRELPTPASALYPGVAAVLAALHAQGYRMAICSNKPQALCAKVLRDTGLEPYFQVVVGGDTASHPKPHAAPLEHALAALGAQPDQAVLIGDSTVDQRAAAAAGLPFIFFRGGYDDGVQDGGLHAAIDLLEHLPALLQGRAPTA